MMTRKRWTLTLLCLVCGAIALTVFPGCGGGGSTTLYAPGVSDVDPRSGVVGTIVTVTGSNFGLLKTGADSATFNGIAAAIVRWSDTRLILGVPDGATTGPFVVRTRHGGSSPIAFTVTGGPGSQRPHIDSVSPTEVEAGEAVTITGSRFGDTRGLGGPAQSGVYFNGIEAQDYVSWSDTQIVAEVPIQLPAGDASVVVATDGGSSNAVFITVVPGPPFIASIDPDTGYQSTEAVITGRNFGKTQGDSKVKFGDEVADPPEESDWGDTKITVLVPPGVEEGFVPVTVTTDRGPSNEVDFLVLLSEITIAIDPDPGAVKLSETLQFAATLGNVPEGADDTVTWSAHTWGDPSEDPRGDIGSETGLYDAPPLASAGITTVSLFPGADKIIATSNLDPSAAGTAIVYFSLPLDEARGNLDLDTLWTFVLDKTRYDLVWTVDGPEIRLELVNGAEAALMDVMTLEEFHALSVDDMKAQTLSTDPLPIRPPELSEGQVIAFKTNEGTYVKGQLDTLEIAAVQVGDEKIWIRFFVFEE